jgi:hypothetical protein
MDAAWSHREGIPALRGQKRWGPEKVAGTENRRSNCRGAGVFYWGLEGTFCLHKNQIVSLDRAFALYDHEGPSRHAEG